MKSNESALSTPMPARCPLLRVAPLPRVARVDQLFVRVIKMALLHPSAQPMFDEYILEASLHQLDG